MKRLISLVITIITMTIICFTSYGADVLYRMLHADEVESFKKDQDAIIVGKIIKNEDDKFTVEVLKLISGRVRGQDIYVKNDFNYGYGDTGLFPKVNDYCVMSIKKKGSVYVRAWGIFKADSGDYRTLNLLTDEIKYRYCNADIAAIEYYVNSGGKEKDFFFKGNEAYARKKDGEKIKIYPQNIKKSQVSVASENYDTKLQNKSESKLNIFLVSILTICITAAIIIISKLKVKKNQ